MLVDLGDGAVEEDDGGVVEALERVVTRELEVVLQPREGVHHLRRRRRRRDPGLRFRRGARVGGDEQLNGEDERQLSCSVVVSF